LEELHSQEIYEALVDDEALGQLPQRLASTVGGRSTIFNWRHSDGGFGALGYCHFTPEFMDAYVETWAALDPWVIAATQPSMLNRVVLLDDAVPSATFARSALYNDFVRASGDDTFHAIGVAYSSPWGEGILGVNRGRAAGAFEAADIARLLPHAKALGQVLRLRGEIATARRDKTVSRTVLDAMAVAIAVVDSNGRLLEANDAAEAVFERADGLTLRRRVVGAAQHLDAVALEAAIALATASTQPAAASLVINRRRGLAAYRVTVSPLAISSPSRRAMLIFRDPETRDASLAQRLRGLFGLSTAEAEIAVDLSEGCSPVELAARRAVTANTMKTQLASLMGKMGCSRQSQVVSIVAALPPLRRLRAQTPSPRSAGQAK
jgi:DNA-binding CsgD family transcriptional regulator